MNRIPCEIYSWMQDKKSHAQAVCRECNRQGPKVSGETPGSAKHRALEAMAEACKCLNRRRGHYHSVVPSGVTLWVKYSERWYQVWFAEGVAYWKYGQVSGGDSSATWVYLLVGEGCHAKDLRKFVRRMARSGYRTKQCKGTLEDRNPAKWSLADERGLQSREKEERAEKRRAKLAAASAASARRNSAKVKTKGARK